MTDSYDTFDEAYQDLTRSLSAPRCGECAPRGERVRELLAAQICLRDPRTRVLSSPARAWDAGFAAGELCWYLRGAEDLASIAYYSKRMPRWSDDGLSLAGAYGPRVFGAYEQTCRLCGYSRLIERHPTEDESGRVRAERHPDAPHVWWPPDGAPEIKSQWQLAREELLRDPDSRRAAVSVYDKFDGIRAARGTRDVPCTMSLQFLLRENSARSARLLHLVATMRSCDLVWGLSNDVFSFSMLQEVMAVELREAGMACELGAYVHQAASPHAYERHWDLVGRVAAEPPLVGALMPPLGSRADLDALLRDETALREGRRPPPVAYGGAAAWLRGALERHREKRDAEAASPREGASR